MKPAVWQRMDVLSRQLTPFLLAIILVLLSAIPFQVPGLARIMPLFSLSVIFHWGVYRAELLPAYAVLIIGFFQDALSGVPMGVHTLVYVLTYGIVLAQQRFFAGKSFYVVWLGFGLVSAGATLAIWLLVSALEGGVIDPRAVAGQYALGIGFYPITAYLFFRWQRTFLR